MKQKKCKKCIKEGCWNCVYGHPHGGFNCICHQETKEVKEDLKIDTTEEFLARGKKWSSPNKNTECKKDTLREWIDVFDLDLEDSKRMATLIDIIVKKVRKEEMDKFEQKLEEYRNSDEVWKNVGISKWKAEGERKGYFTFLNSTGKLNT
jgi:hypothetical protein